MSLTEREKEIALECAKNADMCTEEGSLVVYRGDVLGMFDLFLSRIREEQEAAGYFRDGWNGREEVSEIHKNDEGVEPLFTTPPAAPCDCSELVEALKLSKMAIEASIEKCPKNNDNNFIGYSLTLDKINLALANHAKRMKGDKS